MAPQPPRSQLPPESSGELVLYTTEDGRSRIECRLADGTVWLTQALMAELFQTSPQNITQHLSAIYEEGELNEGATCKDHLQVRLEGNREVRRTLKHYSLEAIIAVGYRVQSLRGTQFRQWATATLREYLVKGFALDDERLKSPSPDAPDYFDELLERIRDIRASEARVYLRIREIIALAADYNAVQAYTQEIYQTVQNKLHFAVTGKTAPEIVAERADHTQPNMGLTTWKGAVVRKGDVTVAKNYLNDAEIRELNRLVVMFLDFAEDMATRRRQLFLANWAERLDAFLGFNERAVLPDKGAVTRERADEIAGEQYARFEERRRNVVEQEAEDRSIRELEDMARRLPKPTS